MKREPTVTREQTGREGVQHSQAAIRLSFSTTLNGTFFREAECYSVCVSQGTVVYRTVLLPSRVVWASCDERRPAQTATQHHKPDTKSPGGSCK